MTTRDLEWMRRSRAGTERELVIAAVVTPFAHDGVDYEGFEENLRFQDAAGLDGVLVAGTTGEQDCLRGDERDRLLERARAVLGPEVFVVSGLRPGLVEVDEAIADVRRAAELGAAVVLVAPPTGPEPAPEPEACRAWFAALVSESTLPVLAYHPPSWRARPLDEALRRALRELPGLSGVKDSLGRRDLVEGWRPTADFAVFVGNATTWLEGVPQIAGGILALASVLPDLFVRAAEARARGDEAALAALIEESAPARDRFAMGGLATLKEMHEDQGLFGGAMRRGH
ncbi:MAG: dihydrodipicolinate synthase family protein [Planctomycetes bacterium]|nr:dihydrodipicolinate synthase family protein [Planctomycetota bacterium]